MRRTPDRDAQPSPRALPLAAMALVLAASAPADAQTPYDDEPIEVDSAGTSSPTERTSVDEASADDEVEADVVDASPAGDEDDIPIPEVDDDGGFSVDDLLAMVPELQLEWGGRVQSDLRVRLTEKSVGGWYDRRTLPVGIDRNENILGIRFTAKYGKVTAKADIDFVLYGFAQEVAGLDDLYRREKLDPFRFDVHRLYLSIEDLFIDGLDLTVGQQLILWGVGDQFNPTNNLNPDDLEDVLLFGDQQGNFMVKLDYWLTREWQFSGVVVPVFQPALLPRYAPLAVAAVDRVPVVNEFLRHRLIAEQFAAGTEIIDHATVVRDINVVLPDRSIENVQVAYRIGGVIGGQDVAISYYNGRTDFPVPFRNHTTQNRGAAGCNPNDPNDCINGLLETNTFLHYPRMHVYGFNMAGEVPWLADISDVFNAVGYRAEIALVVPTRSTLQLTNDELDLGITIQEPGEYDYDDNGRPGGPLPAVVEATPFAKWTLGLDYTFNEYVYANAQWVHGMPDEFGAGDWIGGDWVTREAYVDSDAAGTVSCALRRDGTQCVHEFLRPRIGDYLVLGLDLKFFDQKLLFRTFTIWDLVGVRETFYDGAQGRRVEKHHPMYTEKGFAAVVYPELNYNFGNGLDLGLGALIQLGKRYTKFGAPEAGGTVVWGRTRFAF
jgi:hypothetical protein